MSSPTTTQQYHAQLDPSVHPSVHLAIRNLEQMLYDAQAGLLTMQQQLLGGAVATCGALVNGRVTVVTVQSGGYYTSAPKVTFEGGGFSVQPTAHAVLTGNRVTSVVVDTPGQAGSRLPTVVFTI